MMLMNIYTGGNVIQYSIMLLHAIHQGWASYLLSRVAWIVHYCWRTEKSIDFIL